MFQMTTIGPVVEETTKIITILIGLPSKRVTVATKKEFVKFGATVGLFVAFIENFGLFDVSITMYRAIFSWPFHITPPAVASIGIWKFKTQRDYATFLILSMIAILIHMFYNWYVVPTVTPILFGISINVLAFHRLNRHA